MKWKHTLEQADAELDKVHQQHQKHHDMIKIEQEEIKMSKLEDNYTDKKKDLENVKETLTQHRSEIRVIEELYLKSQKAHIAVQRKIKQQEIKCNTILKECKVCEFLKNVKNIYYKNEL